MVANLLQRPLLQIALVTLVAGVVGAVEVDHIVDVHTVVVVDFELGTYGQTYAIDVRLVLQWEILEVIDGFG